MSEPLHPRVPHKQKMSLRLRATMLFGRIFFRQKKLDPETELSDIARRKQDIRMRIDLLLKKTQELSRVGAALQEKIKKTMVDVERTAQEEKKASERAVRRVYEKQRWGFQEKRRNIEDELRGSIEDLQHCSIEIRGLRLELLRLDRRESEIEEVLAGVCVTAPADGVSARATAHTATSPHVPNSPIARRHILFRDLFSLAVRTFRVKPGMTMLTVLGIGVSFATIFFLVSFGYGLEKVLLDQFASPSLMRSLTVQSPNPEVVPLTKSVAEDIAQLVGVESVTPVFGLSGQLESDALASEVELRGTDPSYFSVSGASLQEGRVFERNEKAIVISASFLQTMNKTSLSEFTKPFSLTAYRVQSDEEGGGTAIIPLGDNFRVIGISSDTENMNVYLSPDFISELVPEYNALNVLARKESDVPLLRTMIAEMGFMSSSVLDTVDQASRVFNIAEIVLALFGAASLVVATIGMVNTMTVSLLERTQEIGIMKVLGVSDGDVRRLFLLEASIIGGLGGASGLVLGIVLSELFNGMVNLLATNLGGHSIALFYYPAWFVGAIFISALAIGFLTGVMPSQRAAKMDPLNAVKYK